MKISVVVAQNFVLLTLIAQARICTAMMSTRVTRWELGSAPQAWITPLRSLTTQSSARIQTTRPTWGHASKEYPRSKKLFPDMEIAAALPRSIMQKGGHWTSIPWNALFTPSFSGK